MDAPGLRLPVQISGVSLTSGPEALDLQSPALEDVIRMQNGDAVVDGAYNRDAQPVKLWKYEGRIAVSRLNPNDYAVIERAKARASWLDLAPWKREVVYFNGDNTTTVFYLPRRVALLEADNVPAEAAAACPTEVRIGGVLKTVTTHYTIGASGTDGWTPITFTSAPASGTENIEVFYAPLLAVRIVSEGRRLSGYGDSRDLTIVER